MIMTMPLFQSEMPAETAEQRAEKRRIRAANRRERIARDRQYDLIVGNIPNSTCMNRARVDGCLMFFYNYIKKNNLQNRYTQRVDIHE